MSADHPMFAVLDQAMDKIMRPDALADWRVKRAAVERNEARLIVVVRDNAADAIECLAGAIRAPRISKWDLQQARAKIDAALIAADELESPEAA
jgi:hypothetical protein